MNVPVQTHKYKGLIKWCYVWEKLVYINEIKKMVASSVKWAAFRPVLRHTIVKFSSIWNISIGDLDKGTQMRI